MSGSRDPGILLFAPAAMIQPIGSARMIRYSHVQQQLTGIEDG